MLDALLAATPIAVILVAMIFFKRSAATAGLLGLVLAVALVGIFFGIPALPEETALVAGVAGAFAEAGFTALTILWIIFGALCLHQLQLTTGAIEDLRDAIAALSADPRIVAILVAWFFALFMEGAAGFGAPIALAAPFLVGFGFPPIQAVTIVLIGHCVGVSFGAVGTPLMAQVQVTEFTGLEIAAVTGDFHLLLGVVMLVAVLVIVTRQAREDKKQLGPIFGWALLAAFSFLVPMWAIARWVGPELPTMGGALIGAVIFVVFLRIFKKEEDLGQDRAGAGALFRAASPYAVVISLILLTRLIGPLQQSLQGMQLRWELFGIFQGSFSPLYHPGTILVIGFFLGGFVQGATKEQFALALKKALQMLLPVTVALVAMLAISRLMVHGQMIDALAEAAAHAGAGWPLLAPFVGVLGSFVTGSATASNILFTDFQLATAERLGLDTLRLVGAQGFGAAVGNIVCPHNIIAGCATVGIVGKEGEVLKRTLGVCVLYAALGGVLAWVLVSG